MVTMSRGYVYAFVCWHDRVGQLGDGGTLRREGQGEGHDYSEVSRWSPPPVSINDCVILAPMTRFDLY
jgi:hypothetical protein